MTKGEETRQFIIEQAAPVFNVKGIAATAMSDVMEATKLSKGSLYVHFENKDVLAAAVVEYNMDQLKKKILAALDKENTAKAKLRAYIKVLGDALNTPVKGGCPILYFGMEADDTNQVVRKGISSRIEFMVKTISDIIKKGVKDGEFKPIWNAREFATLMFSSIEGGIMMSRVAGQNGSMELIKKQLEKIIEEHTW